MQMFDLSGFCNKDVPVDAPRKPMGLFGRRCGKVNAMRWIKIDRRACKSTESHYPGLQVENWGL